MITFYWTIDKKNYFSNTKRLFEKKKIFVYQGLPC